MTNDNRQTQTKPSAPKDPQPGNGESHATANDRGDKPKTIPVKCLTFYQAHPNYNAQMSISAEPAANKTRTIIEFIPSLRHHRVERHAPGQAAVVRFIYEGHVASWEPLA